MRTLATCLALSTLLLCGCSIGPRPGNWGAVAAVPTLSLVDRLVSLPGGAVVASGVSPDNHVTAVVFDSAHSDWLPAVESPLVTGLRDTDILANGELLVTSPQGNWRFRPSSSSWRPAATMSHPRSVYASSSLADGRLLICGGTDESHLALATCETYNPAIDHWAPSATMSTPRFGPLAATLPDGRVFVTGGAFNPTQDGSFDVNLDPLDSSEIFNPATAAFSPAPPYLDPVTDPTLVSLADGRLLAIGGRQGSRTRTATTQELDPRTGKWSIRASPTAFGLGTLLPDGRVFSGGGGLCGTCSTNHPDGQIFSPPYLFNSDGTLRTQPTITSAPPSATTGQTISVATGGPVSSFAMVRYGEATHSVDNDQRRIPLSIASSNGNTYQLAIPSDPGIALPGPYMLFALDANGTPSVSTASW